MTDATVLLSVNTAWNAWNFRAGLIKAIQKQGYRVTVAAPVDAYAERLVHAGCNFIDLPMDSAEYQAELDHRINTSTFAKKPHTPKHAVTDDFAKSFK